MVKKSVNDPYVLMMVSVEQAAGITGLSRSYMYQLVKAKAVKSVKVGRLIKIRTSDLEAFVNNLEINSSDYPDLIV